MGKTATLVEGTMARESWTDERLDDLNGKVDRGFAEVDKCFNRLEDRVEVGFNRVNERIDRLTLVLIAGLVAAIAAQVFS